MEHISDSQVVLSELVFLAGMTFGFALGVEWLIGRVIVTPVFTLVENFYRILGRLVVALMKLLRVSPLSPGEELTLVRPARIGTQRQTHILTRIAGFMLVMFTLLFGGTTAYFFF